MRQTGHPHTRRAVEKTTCGGKDDGLREGGRMRKDEKLAERERRGSEGSKKEDARTEMREVS